MTSYSDNKTMYITAIVPVCTKKSTKYKEYLHNIMNTRSTLSFLKESHLLTACDLVLSGSVKNPRLRRENSVESNTKGITA